MKRDAVALEAPEAQRLASDAPVRRTPAWLGSGTDALFAWYHDCVVPQTECVAVICPPAGSEYTRSHRSLRHLADRLARAGIPALRFDYHGVGDSPGSDLDPARLPTWRANIATAVAHARTMSARQRVFLVGVRLGATLAALATAEVEVERLVLWHPCVKGTAYARELRAIALAAQRATCDLEGAIECAGFPFTAETLGAIAALDLTRAPIRVADRVLVVGRDDAQPDRALSDRFDAQGIANDYRRVPGWAGMMAEHQFTVVPEAALEMVVGWLGAGLPRRRQEPTSPPPSDAGPETIRFPFRARNGDEAAIEETICRFGTDGHLFGVLSRAGAATDRPAVVVFNAGAAHHVGPNRLYVELTRNLAALGIASLRFDLESLGDSVNRRPARENYPYPRKATADGRAAIEFLRERFGYGRFIALGLCSGAHAVFHLGLELADHPIVDIVMINPMQFYWVEGMSLDTSRRFEDMVQYRRSMRDPRRWLKLLRGDVDLPRLLEVVAAQARTQARAWFDALAEAALPNGGPRLSKDLKRLFAMGRRLTLVVSEGDPGRDILLAGAKLTATRALRDGRIRLEMIPDADHTFSQWKPRQEVLGRILAHLRDAARPRDAASSYKRNGTV